MYIIIINKKFLHERKYHFRHSNPGYLSSKLAIEIEDLHTVVFTITYNNMLVIEQVNVVRERKLARIGTRFTP